MRDRKGRTFCASCEKEVSKKPLHNPSGEKTVNKEDAVSKQPEKPVLQNKPTESVRSPAEQPKPTHEPYSHSYNQPTSTSSTKDQPSNVSGVHYCSVQELDQQILILYKSTIYKAIKEIHDRRDVSTQEKANLMKQFLSNHGM